MKNHLLLLLAFISMMVNGISLLAQQRETKRSDEWPALDIKSLRVTPEFPKPNETASIEVVVGNNSEHSTGNFSLLLYTEQGVVEERQLNLGPLTQTTANISWKPNLAGQYWIRCTADPDNDLREKDKTDNFMEISVTVSDKINQDSIKRTLILRPFAPITFQGDEPRVAALAQFATAPVNQWVSVGPAFISDIEGYPWPFAGGRLSAIAIHPTNTSIMYVGAQSSGVWKTTDGGQTWFSLTDRISMSVAALALAPGNPNRIFWVTEHEGVYRSDNAGSTWVKISDRNLEAIVHGGKLIVHPTDPNVLFVKSTIGLYRSGDGGITWATVGPAAKATGVEVANFNADIIYATFSHQTNNNAAGLFRSSDKGLTWVKKLGCPGAALPALVADYKITLAQINNKLFVGFKSSSEFKLYYTTNLACAVGGVQDNEWKKGWSTTTNHLELWSELWANPYDEKRLYLGGTAFWSSTDSGISFEKVSDYNTTNPSAHADHHGFAVLPNNKDVIFSLNDGGIYRSNQNGKKGTWNFVGKGIANVEFYDFASAFTNPSLMIGGTQDNGTIKTNGATEWDAIRGGDGATVDIDDKNADIMYSMGQYASSIARSTNGGNNWTNISAGLPTGSECFNLKWHLHPKNVNILLASCSSLWRITNPNGGTWQTIFTPPNGVVSCSAVEPNSDLYLAGTTRGKLFGGTSGANFQEIFSTGISPLTDVECDPEVPANIYVSCVGNNAGRVFMVRKNNAGNPPFQGTDITNNLPPNLSVQCIAIDRMNAFTLYAGTNKGVYRGRSTNQGNTWQWTEFMDGLPVADVRDLEVHPTTGILRACTFGRSIWEVSTGNPIGSVLAQQGKVTLLRAHEVGTGFGPPGDALDAELIVKLDTAPSDYYGASLRTDTNGLGHTGMLDLLRRAFKSNLPVRIEYVRMGIHSGKIIRVVLP